MSMRFFVYMMPGGPASGTFDTLVDAVVETKSPVGGAVIVQAARAEPSGPVSCDIAMAVCRTPGRWTLTEDGEEEPGTWKLAKAGLVQVEEAALLASVAGDAA